MLTSASTTVDCLSATAIAMPPDVQERDEAFVQECM